jgi:prolyl oligopeptidase
MPTRGDLSAVNYPPTRATDLVDTLHGVAVPDPFRWLEHTTSAESRAWTDAQNVLTRSFLDTPHRHRLAQEVTQAYDYPRTTALLRRGSRYFFSHNPGLLAQAVLYVQDGLEATPRVLLDPNALSADGTVALTAIEPSTDGARLAYAISTDGSDRQEIRVRDVASGVDLDDCLQWVKFASIAWSLDGNGFFYLRFPESGTVPREDEQYFGRLYFHRLGRPQAEDVLVFERPDAKEIVPLADVTADGRFLVVTAQRGASDDSEVFLIDLSRGLDPSIAVFTGFDAAYAYLDSDGDRLFFRTTRDAARGRIISIRASEPAARFEEVVGETGDRLSTAVLAGGRIVAAYLHNASDRLALFDLHGQPAGKIALPGIGSLSSLDGRSDAADVLLTFASFTQPPSSYRCALPATTLEPFGLDVGPGANRDLTPKTVKPRPDPGAAALGSGLGSTSSGSGLGLTGTQHVTRQVWYTSRDGTRVSMFLVHRPDLQKDGNRPVLLSGYGGFNISRTPLFDPGILPLINRGGVFALANLRGDGEYGEEWHRAGMLDRKQNVFDDFIAAAEFLIAERYTRPGRLAIEGGSNGGLLVAAVMLQRPDLLGAVICRVPVADMLRYHLFTVGRFWIPEYGSADDPEQFRFLLKYSPYHNVRPGTAYPATLVMTADTDDRVAPGMAMKFAARLQTSGSGGPFLIRVETKAGHGAGKPVSKLIEEDTDILEFLHRTIGWDDNGVDL